MPNIQEILKTKLLILDGGMGTSLHKYNLAGKDFGGEKYLGCNDYLSITRPDIISEIHEKFISAGSDIIETNTFGASPLTLKEYDLEDKAYDVNFDAAKLAKVITAKLSTKTSPKFVAGSIGPTNKSLSLSKDITFDEMRDSYQIQIQGLVDGNVDILLFETNFDTLNVKAAMSACLQVFKKTGRTIPVAMSATIEKNGTMLAGQDIEAFYTSIKHYNPIAVGINCGLGPDLILPHLRRLSKINNSYTMVYANAGLPQEDGTFPLNPEKYSQLIQPIIKEKLVNIIGGCCGTTYEHIRKIREISEDKDRGIFKKNKIYTLSGIEVLEINEQNRPIIVGERANIIGSRKFKELISNNDYVTASEVAKQQVKAGAQIVDICLMNPDRDEISDVNKFYELTTRKVKTPLMIDSIDSNAVEAALKKCQGKSIINSINFEDGTKRIEKILPPAKIYGASIVFGVIDEDKNEPMAISLKRKVQIAQRAFKYLTEKWDLNPEDIIIDTLVFPIATGNDKYKNSVKDTIDAIKSIKQLCPGVHTALGISNVSFGLPDNAREVLNSVFLYHATVAGLDFAIVNPAKIKRYSQISEEEIIMAENLLFNKKENTLNELINYYKGKKVEPVGIKNIPLESRLKKYIVNGEKIGLIEDLDEKVKSFTPLDIINKYLMEGMKEVGKLFNENKLIVTEVLESAEVMKTAVDHLEKFMDKQSISKKGKILLATVKGDVHDIGKNLLNIILSNNGFEIIDLGIKVSSEVIIENCKKYKPDCIALSGLLVRSALEMVQTAEDLKNAGINAPIIVGGAALNEKFAIEKITPAYGNKVSYGKDAMDGLRIIEEIIKIKNEELIIENRKTKTIFLNTKSSVNQLKTTFKNKSIKILDPSSKINDLRSVFYDPRFSCPAPDYIHHILSEIDINEVFAYIDEKAFYYKQLGYRGSLQNEIKDKKIFKQVEEMKNEIVNNRLLKPKAVYQFFKCKSSENNIVLEIEKFRTVKLSFERQQSGNHFCLADLVSQDDSMAIFVCTVGEGVSDYVYKLNKNSEYVKSHIFGIISIMAAEALAELIHKRIRELWGIETKKLSKSEILTCKYQGLRYSYGYPACPDLNGQKQIFKLLKPEKIGVKLTDSLMMEPEASVSALVFHNPNAKYFSIT